MRSCQATVALIRTERASDHAAVYALNAAAFESPAEAMLVDRLRREAATYLALVAEVGGTLIGHIAFTPVELPRVPRRRIMGLAPMAVASTHRTQGVGSALVRAGLERCAQEGHGAVIVLGHPGYYPRFGFKPACGFGLGCEFEVLADAFMAIELIPNYLAEASGTVSYHVAFRDL